MFCVDFSGQDDWISCIDWLYKLQCDVAKNDRWTRKVLIDG